MIARQRLALGGGGLDSGAGEGVRREGPGGRTMFLAGGLLVWSTAASRGDSKACGELIEMFRVRFGGLRRQRNYY